MLDDGTQLEGSMKFDVILMYIYSSIGWMAIISSFLISAAGSKVCLLIIRRKATGDIALFPFVASLFNAVILLKYGLLTSTRQLIITAAVNTICQIVYIIIYYIFAANKRKCHRLLGLSLPILYGILIYVKYFIKSEKEAIVMLGTMSIVFGILMCASPLVSLPHVMASKTTKSLDFNFILANCISCLLWTLTGLILRDWVVIIPNGTGIFLTSFQLLLFAWYPSTSSKELQIDKEKLADGDLSVATENL